MTPGIESAKCDLPERHDAAGSPRSSAASTKRIIHLFQSRINRQDEERQIGIDDTDENTAVLVLRIFSGVSMTLRPHQKLIQQSLGLQNAYPRINANKKTGPEWKNDKHKQMSG